MGLNRLFVPQEVLDEWVVDGMATLEDQELSLPNEGESYTLTPAFRFIKEAAGAEDPHDLIGRVKEQADIEALGAEAYMDSVLLDDNAYDVQPGFVGVPAGNAPQEGAPESAAAEPEQIAEEAPRTSKSGVDSDELAELLLKHLK